MLPTITGTTKDTARKPSMGHTCMIEVWRGGIRTCHLLVNSSICVFKDLETLVWWDIAMGPSPRPELLYHLLKAQCRERTSCWFPSMTAGSSQPIHPLLLGGWGSHSE